MLRVAPLPSTVSVTAAVYVPGAKEEESPFIVRTVSPPDVLPTVGVTLSHDEADGGTAAVNERFAAPVPVISTAASESVRSTALGSARSKGVALTLSDTGISRDGKSDDETVIEPT
jgi:hypothetical protein